MAWEALRTLVKSSMAALWSVLVVVVVRPVRGADEVERSNKCG